MPKSKQITGNHIDVRSDDYKYNMLLDRKTERRETELYTLPNKKNYIMAKCIYVITNAINLTQEYKVNPETIWNELLLENNDYSENGVDILTGLKYVKKQGYIDGYATLETIEESKNALDLGRVILAGSNGADWSYIKSKKIYIARPTIGEYFLILGYNDSDFICHNPRLGEFNMREYYFNKIYKKKYVISKDGSYRFIKSISESIKNITTTNMFTLVSKVQEIHGPGSKNDIITRYLLKKKFNLHNDII